jgi:hypothetical protein
VPIGSPENAYDLSLVEAFRKGLRQVGLIEDQNIVLDIVWSGNDPDQAVKEVLGRGAEFKRLKYVGSGEASDLDHSDCIPACW